MTRFLLLAGACLFLIPAEAIAQRDDGLGEGRYTTGVALGLRTGGRGELRTEFSALTNNSDTRDESGIHLSAYAMSKTGPINAGLRLGYLTKMEVDPDDASNYAFGSAVDARLRLEYPFSISVINLHGFAEGGGYVLFPDDDLKDTLDTINQDTDPRFGLLGGLGVGVSYRVIPQLGLRADFLLSYHTATIIDESDALFDYKMELDGTRVQLLLGVMF